MILFERKFIFAVDTIEQGEQLVNQLERENVGSMLSEVKKKFVKTKQVEYYKFEVTLQFVSEKEFKKGEA